jgi:hypothetical protein
LQADGYGGFAALYDEVHRHEAACWAHARRKYYDVYVADRSPTALEALRRIGALYDLEREIRGLPAATRLAARGQRATPLLQSLREWLQVQRERLSTKSPLSAAIQYTLVRWRALTRYLEDSAVEIDNNAAERAIRALTQRQLLCPAALTQVICYRSSVVASRNLLPSGSTGADHGEETQHGDTTGVDCGDRATVSKQFSR